MSDARCGLNLDRLFCYVARCLMSDARCGLIFYHLIYLVKLSDVGCRIPDVVWTSVICYFRLKI